MIGHDEAALIAQGILDLRQSRTDHLPADIFGEYAWAVLLVMFVADAAGERLSADDACRRAGGTTVVTRRWMNVLRQHGLVACKGSCKDGNLVALTPEGVHAVEACMNDARKRMSGGR